MRAGEVMPGQGFELLAMLPDDRFGIVVRHAAVPSRFAARRRYRQVLPKPLEKFADFVVAAD
jgi:hypothetical protein